MDIKTAINRAINREDIAFDDMLAIMRTIMSGEATPAQIAGLLVALNMKGETIDEVSAAATVMRELATPVKVDCRPLIDTCGTGGDATNTFNISTATAFVVAAAGGYVAKHGNRSVSSSSGSADVLEQAGAVIDLGADDVAYSIEHVGVGFMFAPAHHGATRHAAAPRRELGVRTLFNVLGPLTNPAAAPIQLLGVFDRRWQELVAEVLPRLGVQRAFVVNAEDGLDEISIGAKTRVAEIDQGEIRYLDIDPQTLGITLQSIETIRAADAADSLSMISKVFDNQPGPAHDIVCMNAAAAIYLCDLADSIADGLDQARDLLASGTVMEKFDQFVSFTRERGKLVNE